MAPRQFVVPEALGFKVGIRGRIEVQLAHRRIAEAFAHHGLDFASGDRTSHNASLWNPLGARNAVVINADTSIDSEPRQQVLTDVDVAGNLVTIRLAALLIRSIDLKNYVF